jgi:hypothetical protein
MVVVVVVIQPTRSAAARSKAGGGSRSGSSKHWQNLPMPPAVLPMPPVAAAVPINRSCWSNPAPGFLEKYHHHSGVLKQTRLSAGWSE